MKTLTATSPVMPRLNRTVVSHFNADTLGKPLQRGNQKTRNTTVITTIFGY